MAFPTTKGVRIKSFYPVGMIGKVANANRDLADRDIDCTVFVNRSFIVTSSVKTSSLGRPSIRLGNVTVSACWG